MQQATSPSRLLMPDGVITFAAEQAVQAELPGVIEMTRRLFPHADVRVELDDDPEIAGDRHIVLLVKAGKMSVDQAVASRWQWHQGLLGCCPAPLLWVFRLGLELGQ